MRQPGSDTILGAVLQEGNVTVRHKLTLEWVTLNYIEKH